ncbi:unnamed protein product, partial [Prorocentrum cordatum]
MSADAAGFSTDGAGAAASAHEQFLSLTCMRCQEPTTMADSYPSGRTADFKKKKESKVPLAKDDVNVKANINKLSPDERVDFYRAEKAKDGPGNAKRSFVGVKGSIEHGKVESLSRDELNTFETFEDCAFRQIGLERCEDEEGAKRLWLQALSDPEKQNIKIRGQWLLWKFGGSNARNAVSDVLRNALTQAQMIGSKDGLDEFLKGSSDLQARREKRIKKDFQVQAGASEPGAEDFDVEGGVALDDGMISDKAAMKTISAQLINKAKDSADQERGIIQAAQAQAQAKGPAAPEPSPAKKPKTSVFVAKMGLEPTVTAQRAHVDNKVETAKEKFYSEATDGLKCYVGEDGRAEFEDMTDVFDQKFDGYAQQAEKTDNDIKAALQNLTADLDADAILDKRAEVMAVAKAFAEAEHDPVEDIANAVGAMIANFKSYAKKAKEAAEKRGQ